MEQYDSSRRDFLKMLVAAPMVAQFPGLLARADVGLPRFKDDHMSVSARIKAALESSSWIRRMFEEGAELKARLGPEQVCDFTLGNPDLEPPPRFK